MNHSFEMIKFTPGEAEDISGVSTALQRDWRHRGFLPSTDGTHARFDAFGVAELMLMGSLSARGIGPQIAKPIAEIASGAVVFGALMNPKALQGEGDFRKHPEDTAHSVVRRMGPSKVHRNVMIPRHLIVWADGKDDWCFNVQEAIDGVPDSKREARLGGPFIVIDQHAVGDILFAKANRPLVWVETVKD